MASDRQCNGEFEAEAHRQSLELAAVARDPDSDEAAMLRELDALFDELAAGAPKGTGRRGSTSTDRRG